ncbi:MAG: glutamate-1-semialdehyde 2,1-aminomutase, partial [Bdellovibrionales bacterium]|nr:glutamate-1-semialdehyde 2,1-aminomutase [Bdellovibrionales bacterium]
SLIPSAEMVRLVNSGTEATMTAVRLARGATGRDTILKFNGHYHGHADTLLVDAGSGVATLGIPGSPGIPAAVAALTVSIRFNELDLFEEAIERIGPQSIAAVILEPVAGNMGLVLPGPGFLEGLRKLCSRHGIILIFDEVMSGFRVAMGGAQEFFGVQPDLTTFGKVIGGGLPLAALVGRRDLMSQLAPSGQIYQAGTLSGNPLAVSAGLAVVRQLRAIDPYPQLGERAARWAAGLKAVAEKHGIALQTSSCGSMVGLFFSASPVNSFEDAKRCDTEAFKRFFHGMLARGIYLAPSAFEAGFIGLHHTAQHIEQTIDAAEEVFSSWSA